MGTPSTMRSASNSSAIKVSDSANNAFVSSVWSGDGVRFAATHSEVISAIELSERDRHNQYSNGKNSRKIKWMSRDTQPTKLINDKGHDHLATDDC